MLPPFPISVRQGGCMAGHVFITLGDITRLNSDAWLLPTDYCLFVEEGWYERVPGLAELVEPVCNIGRATSWGCDGQRSLRVLRGNTVWKGPVPYLVDVAP